MKGFGVEQDREANALYVTLSEGEPVYAEVWPEGTLEGSDVMVIVPFDAEGRALGVEVLLPGAAALREAEDETRDRGEMSGERRRTGPHPIWARKPRGKNLPLPTREDLLRSRAEAERDRTQKPGGSR